MPATKTKIPADVYSLYLYQVAAWESADHGWHGGHFRVVRRAHLGYDAYLQVVAEDGLERIAAHGYAHGWLNGLDTART